MQYIHLEKLLRELHEEIMERDIEWGEDVPVSDSILDDLEAILKQIRG